MTKNNILIILPGWGGSHTTWKQFTTFAKKEMQEVFVIDLPCFGDEPCPKAVWGVEEYANFVEKKINKIKEEYPNKKVVLLGHSFGGQVATILASQNARICDTLILSGAPVYRVKRPLKKALFGCIAKAGKVLFSLPLLKKIEPLAKRVLYRVAKSPDYSKTDGIQREIFKKVIIEDVSDRLENITMPTLLLWGEKDTYVPLKYAKKIHQHLSQSQLEVITGGTHGLHLKNIDDMIKHIKTFLS
ncbi:alpha/beta hydrolase [Patescibacteria group bacterium]|nr:alpha/beta hydrolase [Patescibacteria group bacterium]